ncbi:MAG: 3,5-cyclic-AMP phosphodiesterase [Actinomycetota bacterium]|nr:3,5-cyclic-AMP phosphodiesterase [Actinomycetota bacterium]
MTRAVSTVTRPWPLPRGGVTLHCIGDIHAGIVHQTKLDKCAADSVNGLLLPTVAARLQLGDLTEAGTAPQITQFNAWWSSITGAPKYLAMGNHDFFAGATPAQWATAFGMPSNNYTATIAAGLKLIVIGADGLTADESNPAWDGVRIRLSNATLSFLDTELGNTSSDCIIACHAPIKDTVLGGASAYQSSDSPWFVTSQNALTTSSGILAVLAAHTNAKAWICGHTHSPIDASGLVTFVTAGSHKVACISTSAIVYVGQNSGVASQYFGDPMHGLYVTYFGDRIEVRFRNHGAGMWNSASGVRMTSITL